VGAKITDEDIAKMRLLIGQPERFQEPAWNPVATVSDFTRFQNGLGDANPLYSNVPYAKNTRWKSVIAPPMFMITMGREVSGPLPPGLRARTKGALSGISMYQSGYEFEFSRAIYQGDELEKRSGICSVEEKRSEFSGRSVHIKHQSAYTNQRGEHAGLYRHLLVYSERATAAEKGKYMSIRPARYGPEQVKAIDEAYGREYVRGARPRWWEDVKEKESLPVMVRGPLTMVDIIGFHIAIGLGNFNTFPGRLDYLKRRQMPRFYVPGRYGFPEAVQRMHWDEDWARRIGLPMAYDYGMMRAAYAIQYVTNWMGDDAWLWKVDIEVRRFNFHGDIQWFHGTVARKVKDGAHRCVEIDLGAENQRGETTTVGSARLILPSREGGPVTLPATTG